MIITVGIDAAKDKHNCFILSSEEKFCQMICDKQCCGIRPTVESHLIWFLTYRQHKVGLSATGHYSYYTLEFLLEKGLPLLSSIPCTPTCIEKPKTTKDQD